LFNRVYSDAYSNKVLKRVAIKCRIDKDLSMHVMRHTFCTLFSKAGGSPWILKEVVGHDSIKTTSKYVHLANDSVQKKKQLTRYANFLATVPKPKKPKGKIYPLAASF